MFLILTLIVRERDTWGAGSVPWKKRSGSSSDIEIVGEVADESEIIESVNRTLPNFVVIALDQPGRRPRVCDDLLREHPEVRVIAVAPAKNYVVYYWASLDIHSSNIEASEEGMLSALRSSMVADSSN